MLLVWISGTLLSLPYILYTRFLEFDWIGGHERLCQVHFPSIESRRAYVTIFCLLGYVLPMLVMFFLISVALRRPQGVTRDNMTQEDRMRCQMKRRVSRFLFFIFYLCSQCILNLWEILLLNIILLLIIDKLADLNWFRFFKIIWRALNWHPYLVLKIS